MEEGDHGYALQVEFEAVIGTACGPSPVGYLIMCSQETDFYRLRCVRRTWKKLAAG